METIGRIRMANPNPNPSTRFGANGDVANPSRSKQHGARDRLSAAFLADFADDWSEHGKTVIVAVRDKDPVAYMRIAAALQPNKVEVSEDPITALSAEDLEHLHTLRNPASTAEEIRAAIQARAAAGAGRVEE